MEIIKKEKLEALINGFHCSKELKKKFIDTCRINNVMQSDVLRSFVIAYVKEMERKNEE